jgi:hypothetical protein
MVIIAVIANLALWHFSPDKARASVGSTGSVLKEMLMVLPPMFILPGLKRKSPRGTSVPIAPVAATKSALQDSARIEDNVTDFKGDGMISPPLQG